MALFKLAVSYEGRSDEETLEVEARSPAEARSKCEEMVAGGREELERLARFNVYTSRIVQSCRVCSRGYEMDMVLVKEMLDSLKSNPD